MKSLEQEPIFNKHLEPRQMEYLQLNRDFTILDASEGVQRLADCPYEVMPGRDARLCFPELIGVEDILIDILQGRRNHFELKSIARFSLDSSPLYIDLYVRSFESKLIIFFEDATSRMVWQETLVQRTHEANLLLNVLGASQNYIDQILTSMADALLVTTPSGNIKTINKAALDLFGYSEAELIDKHISNIIADENLLSQINPRYPGSQGKFLQDYEVVCQTKTGTEVFVAFSKAVIQTDIENLEGFVYIGRDITERKRDQARQDVENATTRILSESATLEEATLKILEAICKYLGWELGELWSVNQQANVLRYVETWQMPSVKVPEFLLVSRQISFAPGVGLPGRVWASGQPVWINDVVHDPNFLPTARSAVKEGLHGAFGFPIKSGNDLLGVMTFFSCKIQSPQSDLLKMMAAIGSQIGQFIKHKQAELALQESEQRFQAFMNNTPAVAFMKDESGRFVYVNKQLERSFNIKQADLQGKTDFDWLPEQTAKQVCENDIYVLSTGLPVEIIETVPTPDGYLHYWLSFKFPFKNGEGQQFVGGVSVDITERQHLEQELRQRLEQELFEEKELAHVTLQSIGDAVITTDAQSHIRYLNPVAEELTGWSQQSAQGKPLTEVFRIVNETTREPVQNPLEKALPEGCIVGLTKDSVLISRNGDEFAIEESAAPIRASNGQIIGAVMVFRDVTTTRSLSRQLTWQATHDALTGLVNRHEFENRLEQNLTLARTENQQHALCYLDLDQFKIVNDTCGHIAGDQLLRQVTTLFQAQVRSSDILARLGGDEFGILLKHCSIEPAVQIANTLLQRVQAFRFVWQDKTFNIGISIGLVAINAESESVTSILSAADAACYAAKNKGRNRVHIYQADDSELAQQHGEMQWVTRITQALEENRFRLYYQSIVPITKTELNGEHYEVLLRLIDEMGNLVSPMAFIPAAERYNLMQTLDRWVVRTLFATQGQHYREKWNYCQSQRIGCDYLYAINLSGASINDEQFMEFLHEQFALHQIPPAVICFEITETAAIANLGKAAQFIRSLRELGCHFALDDFGSGMSSFAYLKNLPVDYLKIDGSFVKHIVDQPIDLAMVEAINQIGHVMGIQTIAEFVENQDILEKITALKVDYAQGYGIAIPRPL